MLWYALGAALGALQLAVPLASGRRKSEMPFLFVIIGAVLGSAVYGTILWLVFDQWLEL